MGEPSSGAPPRAGTARLSAIGVAAVLVFALTGCDQPRQQNPAPGTHPLQEPGHSITSADKLRGARALHDLSADEAMGGHTLARHVGKTDEQLVERLRREPQISSASTYADRETAEQLIAAALESPGRAFDAWRRRTGRRPNFALRYAADHVIGRAISRGRTESAPCRFALIVLRWDERRDRYYVLTSYPEEHR
jgi:CDI toxin RNase A-like protein